MSLSDPHAIGSKRVPNRFVALPVETNLADGDRGLSEHSLARYSQLADGGWGTVVLEATSVSRTSVGGVRGLVLDDQTALGFERLVADFKQRNPEGALLLQLTHSGRNSRPPTDRVTVCPAPLERARYLSTEDIEVIRRQFVETALLAETLGFDGVEIKACHGYFGAEILRPANTRPDRWGGTFDNRVRFLEEAAMEVRARRQSADFLLGSRISCYENTPGGMGTAGPDTTNLDFTEIAELLRRLGRLTMDFVIITSARPEPWPPAADLGPEEREEPLLWFERLTKECVDRDHLGLTVIGAGYSTFGDRAVAVAEARIAQGVADLPGWGRLTYADPLFPKKLQAGEAVDWCVGCMACGRGFSEGKATGCFVHASPWLEPDDH
ncbi:MAG: hypothetical protein HN849_29340 [Victivallales bacterium]|nr:hypothetical protein [Victivallales bacterium]